MDPLDPEVAADKIDTIPEALRPYYKPLEGDETKLRLQVARQGGLALEDVTGLERTLAERKDKHRKAADRVAIVEGLLGDGLTFDDLPEVFEGYGKFKKGGPPGPGGKGLSDEEVQRRVTEALGGKELAWGTERDTLVSERDDARGQLETHLRTSVAQAAIVKAKGSVELLLPHVLRRIQVVTGEDGSTRAVVVDDEGRPMEVVKDGNLVPVDPVDFVNEHFKKSDAFGAAFSGANVAGSGSKATTPAGGPGGVNPFSKSSFNLTEISRLQKENPTEAQRLKLAVQQSGEIHPLAAGITVGV